MAVDPKFIFNLRGKDFVLFPGVLDQMHRCGLRSIETRIVTEFSDPKERCWVVEAIGTFLDAEGKDRVWSAYGDASPANSQMKGAELRHAETRAIARLGRMAANIAMTAFEELGGQDEESETPRAGSRNGSFARESLEAPRPDPAPQQIRARHDPEDQAERLRNGETPRPVVGTTSGAPRCHVCDRELTPGQAQVSQKHLGDLLCPEHQRAAMSEASARVQATR